MIDVLEVTTYAFKTISMHMVGWSDTELVWARVYEHNHYKEYTCPCWHVLLVMVRQNGKYTIFRVYQHTMKDGKGTFHSYQIIDGIDAQLIHNEIDPELSELCELALRSFLL